MIERLKELFLFYVASPEQKTDKALKIELASCPLREMICNVHLSAVNNYLIESEKYRKEEDFNKSIEILETAFLKSSELLNHPCSSCARHFLTKIFEALESLNDELEKKSKGLLSKKKYISSYKKAKSLLAVFELAAANNKFQFNNSGKLFLGNHLN